MLMCGSGAKAHKELLPVFYASKNSRHLAPMLQNLGGKRNT